MPSLLSTNELRSALHMEYDRSVLSESREKREQNINSFLEIDRENLNYGSVERRLLLYNTLIGEQVHIQYPGKESEGRVPNPKDFRPKLTMSNGKIMQDASFGFIWDIFENIGKKHNEYLRFIAALLIQMQYLYKYELVEDSYKYEKIFVENGEENSIGEDYLELRWNKISLSDDIWYTLNDRIGMIEVPDGEISFEGFIKFIDLLLQNEDCKYYYKNDPDGNRPFKWNTTGRPSTVATNLRILKYLENQETLSDLLNAIQKGRGVMSFRKADYRIVTDDIVVNIEHSD